MDRVYGDEKETAEKRKAPAPAPEPSEVLDLQRSAGNAAVTRMIARDFNPFAVDLGTTGIMDDYYKAMDAVRAWFDGVAKESGNVMAQSVAELVATARELTVKTKSGQVKPVSEVVIQAADVERTLREQAKTRGVKMLEHRSLGDPKGVESEALATLKNLGVKLPEDVSFGGDDAKITIGIGGTVKGAVKVAGADVEAEASKEGFKLDLKAGELVTVKGSVTKSGDDWEWKADLQIGTLGKVITPDEIAKVMKGAQDTFGNGARALASGITPEKVKEHGSSVKEAVEGVVEKAKKSAEQAKPGWQVGVGVQGGGKDGGFSASVTLTWVF